MRVLRFLPALFFGIVIGAVLGWIITKDYLYAIAFAVGLGPGIMATTFLALRNAMGSGVADHGLAAARVEWVQRVGASAAGSQQADVRVCVFSRDDAPYQTTMRATVDDAALRAMQAGSLIAVMRLGPRVRPDVSYVPAPPVEFLERLNALKAEASTLPAASAVKAWETATTTTPGTPKPDAPRARTVRWISIVIALTVAAVVLIPAYPSIARGVHNIVSGRLDGSDMVTGLYQQDAVDDLIAAAGTSRFTFIGFYNDYVLADAVSRTGPDRTDEVQWRYGRAWVEGPSFSQSSDLRRELFDAAGLDFSVVAEVARDGAARAGIEDREYLYAFVRADYETGEPEITISISGPYEQATITYGFDGEVRSATGPMFD